MERKSSHIINGSLKFEIPNNLSVCSEFCKDTVLLIDDNAFNYMIFKEVLKDSFNINSTCFERGKEAVDCF